FGAGHQHEDKLTFILFAGGRPQIIDAGNYYYNASRWRRYVLSTRGHNTVMVDGLDQHRRRNRDTYVLTPPFEPLDNVWISAESFDYVVGTYDDGYGPERKRIAAHTRSILFVKPDYWIVTDTLTPSDAAEHTYESLFHLNADEAAVDDDTKAVMTGAGERSGVAIVPLPAEGLEVEVVKGREDEPVQGWANHPWRPVPTAVYRLRASGPVDMLHVLYPRAAGDPPIATVEAIPVEAEAPAVGAAIRFTDGSAHYFVQHRSPGGPIGFADFETDARMALVKMSADGAVQDTLHVGGTYVRRSGG
ncbi:MAG: heparinase II/III-family protein, partial [Armatimonadota bacterium]